MLREDLRDGLYSQTEEYFSDQELDDYLYYHIQNEFDLDDRISGNMNNEADNMKPSLFQDEEDYALLGDDIIDEVNDLFSMVLRKAKEATIKIEVKQQIDEIVYFTKIFTCKCLLYLILQNGKEKGYKWRYL